MFITSPYWKQTRLTKSGRPELLNEDGIQENDIFIQNNVGLYQDNYKLLKYQKGKLYLTNKRLIFADNSPGSDFNLDLNLIDIDEVAVYNGFLKSSPKVILKMVKKDKSRIELRHNSISKPVVSEVNWICQICSFSNAVKTDLHIEADSDVPPCKNCGMHPPRYLVEGVIQAATKELTPANNVVSSEGFQCPTCTFLNDVSMKNCEMCGSRLVSSNLPPQLLKEVRKKKELRLELEGSDNGSGNNNADLDLQTIKLSFRKGGVKTFLEKLIMAKDQLIWEHLKSNSKLNVNATKVESSPLKKNPQAHDGLKFGIQGLQNKREIERFESSLLLNNSLQDLENLMEKAKDLIKLSNNFQQVLTKGQSSNNSKITDTANILSNSKNSVNILNNIITKNEFVNTSADSTLLSSLRKKSKNSDLYIEELSRQIFEFLVDSDLIAKNHGLITMFDLYIIYNRARGINLISPDELLKSVKLFEKLRFKYILIEVPLIKKSINDLINNQGAITDKDKADDKFFIISNRDFTFNTIFQNIIRYIDHEQQLNHIYQGLSILEIQKNPRIHLNVNYLILNQLLLECCLDGRLCVDQGLEGSFFFKNEILDFNWQDYKDGNDKEVRILDRKIELDSVLFNRANDSEDYEEDEDVQATRDFSPAPNLEEELYQLDYRLGSRLLLAEDDTENQIEEIGSNIPINSALNDLQGLHF